MKSIDVKKLARLLRFMVDALFVCNIIALFLVPLVSPMMAAQIDGQRLLASLTDLKLILFWLIAFGLGISPWNWNSPADSYIAVLALFLLLCGVCTAVILRQAKRVLDTILRGEPFAPDNAGNLKRAAVCCFVISGAALARAVWGVWALESPASLLSYNTLFVPAFFMAGLLFMVMSALFRQATELKEENDLTI